MEVIEIPFGAKDSELQEWTYTIPEGMEAEIKDGKVIIKRKENEDEKIRQGMIRFLNSEKAEGIFTYEARQSWIAYLEKQKINTEGDFGRGYDCGYEACLHSHGAEFFEKQKERKPAEWSEDIIRKGIKEVGLTQYQIKWLKNNVFPPKKEQKPEWSEEDKNKLNHILEIVHIASGREASVDEKEELESFLKSLHPQPKNEWSEEDKFKLEDAITGIDAGIGFYEREGKHPNLLKAIIEVKEWLKSLRPQPKQEWSEEDEYLMDETIKHLEELIRIDKAKHCGVDVQYYQRDIDWLKSFPKRFNLQPKDDEIEEDE